MSDDDEPAPITDLIPDLDAWWERIRHEINFLRHRRELHDELVPRMLEVSNHSTVAAGFIHRMYIEVQLMSIRRMTDSTKPTHSLRRLLGQLAEHSCAITRTSFVA